jgi:hypothetical protein
MDNTQTSAWTLSRSTPMIRSPSAVTPLSTDNIYNKCTDFTLAGIYMSFCGWLRLEEELLAGSGLVIRVIRGQDLHFALFVGSAQL